MIVQDKVALVTGGTAGIGRATAIAYAQQHGQNPASSAAAAQRLIARDRHAGE